MSNQAIVSELSLKNKGLNFDEPILVRSHFGSSWQPILLRPIEQSHKQDRLISLILRGQAEAASFFLEQEFKQEQASRKTHGTSDGSNAPNWLRQFFIDAGLGNIAALLYEQICALNLVELFEQGEANKAQLAMLRSRAAFSGLEWNRLNEHLNLMTGKLSEYSCLEDCLWLKGTSLSRSLYKKPSHRLSCDFDLLIKSSPKERAQILNGLAELDLQPFVAHPGFCQQYGVGPTRSLKDLFLSPSPELEGCHNLTLVKENCPYVEVKFSPLETGMRMHEIDRLFSQAIKIGTESAIWAPSPIDHLLIELPHLHKHGLQGWSWLYDIHLLVDEINRQDQASDKNWEEFVRRCRLEGIEQSTWAGLALAKDRLGTLVPDTVLEELYSHSIHGPQTYAVSTEFIWNCNSLPILLLNAIWHGDRKRKLKALKESFFPSQAFLSSYYGGELTQETHHHWYHYLFFYMIHLFVLTLPAGVVRRSFGKRLFSSDKAGFKV